MKKLHTLGAILMGTLLLVGCNIASTETQTAATSQDSVQSPYVKEILQERAKFQHVLLETDSILNRHEQATIKRLRYFPIDTTWIVEAPFTADTGEVFEMATSSDRLPKYQQIGWVTIQHQTDSFRLAVYQSLELDEAKYKHMAFIPFVDGNSPELTYGGGRYMEVDIIPGDTVVQMDFNRSINPYCVYSYNYSCPITPKVNHITAEVKAGVMNPVKTY